MTPDALQSLRHLPNFPATARELIMVAGVAAAAKLITAWPGQIFPVPAKVGGTRRQGIINWHRLTEIVGNQAAGAIVRHWGGSEIYIPSAKKIAAEHIHDRVRADFDRLTIDQGYSGREAIFELGVQHQLSYRMVEIILSRPDSGGAVEAGEQLALYL